MMISLLARLYGQLDYQGITDLIERHGSYLDDEANEYGEPGYTLEKGLGGILFANWNPVPKFVGDALELLFELEWSDEWIVNCETSKAYRCSPNSYGWKPYFILTDGGDVIGGDDIESDEFGEQDWYVDEYLLNDPEHVCVFVIDLESRGFELVDDSFENGFHPGQTDEPKKIMDAAQEEMPDYDFLFGNLSVGQFDISWSLWKRPKPEGEGVGAFEPKFFVSMVANMQTCDECTNGDDYDDAAITLSRLVEEARKIQKVNTPRTDRMMNGHEKAQHDE